MTEISITRIAIFVVIAIFGYIGYLIYSFFGDIKKYYYNRKFLIKGLKEKEN